MDITLWFGDMIIYEAKWETIGNSNIGIPFNQYGKYAHILAIEHINHHE